MKTFAALGLAALLLPAAASAQSASGQAPSDQSARVDMVNGKPLNRSQSVQPHAVTAAAMLCMLDHQGDRCKIGFAGDAWRTAKTWLFWSPNKDFSLGDLVSAEYAYTQAQNAYTTTFAYGRAADVYYVKYKHQDYTFYLVPPGADGKIVYMLARSGTPADEKSEPPAGLSRIR